MNVDTRSIEVSFSLCFTLFITLLRRNSSVFLFCYSLASDKIVLSVDNIFFLLISSYQRRLIAGSLDTTFWPFVRSLSHNSLTGDEIEMGLVMIILLHYLGYQCEFLCKVS